MLQFGNMNDELTRYNTNLREKVAPALQLFSEYPIRGGHRTHADLS
jgi:hypothetical protein